MRVPDSKRYDMAASRVQDAKARNAKSLEQISTTKRINTLTDDPIGYSSVINLSNTIGNVKQYQRNLNFAKGFVENTELALTGLTDKLIRAKELAVGMANDTYGADSKEAVSKEIGEIMKEVVGLGNTSFNNRYVFSGFRTQTPSFDVSGQFLGDDGKIFIPISMNSYRQVNIPGRNLFEATEEEQKQGHFNLIDALDVFQDGLTNNDKPLIHKALDEIDFQIQKVTSFQANVGAIFNGLEAAGKRLEMEEEASVKQRSEVEDVDIYAASTDFKQSEAVMQNTLLATNKLLQPSLLNFMQ